MTILAFAVSMGFTVVFVLLLFPLAWHFGLVAEPGDHRRHEQSTPLIGGLAIFLALLVTARLLDVSIPTPVWLAMALVLIFGIIDDHWTLPFWIRFVVQIAAAMILVESGVVIYDLGLLVSDELLTLGKWKTALTVFSIVGVINAVNMIDGMDGLAGIIVLVALSSILYLVSFSGPFEIVLPCILMFACVCGFLVFNLRFSPNRPARVFLGDAGTTMLGLFLSWILITGSQGTEPVFPPVAAIWILSVPLFDTVGVMLRRLMRGQSPFHADRIHTHHLFLQAGLTTNQALLSILVAAAFMSMAGIMGIQSGVPESIMFYAFLVIFALYVAGMEIGFRKIQK